MVRRYAILVVYWMATFYSVTNAPVWYHWQFTNHCQLIVIHGSPDHICCFQSLLDTPCPWFLLSITYDMPVSLFTTISIWWHWQKNWDNGQIIPFHHDNNDPLFCPVSMAIHIIQHSLHLHLKPMMPLYSMPQHFMLISSSSMPWSLT